MSTQEPAQSAALTSLPRIEDVPQLEGGGYDPDGVRDAFDAFRRHALQLQAQLRVLQAAGKTANVDPTGHAVRMYADATRVDAKLRYRSPAVTAQVEATSSGFTLELDEPAYGVAAGQAAVLYDDDVVVGAGLVTSARAT